jgi:hypothetical protein
MSLARSLAAQPPAPAPSYAQAAAAAAGSGLWFQPSKWLPGRPPLAPTAAGLWWDPRPPRTARAFDYINDDDGLPADYLPFASEGSGAGGADVGPGPDSEGKALPPAGRVGAGAPGAGSVFAPPPTAGFSAGMRKGSDVGGGAGAGAGLGAAAAPRSPAQGPARAAASPHGPPPLLLQGSHPTGSAAPASTSGLAFSGSSGFGGGLYWSLRRREEDEKSRGAVAEGASSAAAAAATAAKQVPDTPPPSPPPREGTRVEGALFLATTAGVGKLWYVTWGGVCVRLTPPHPPTHAPVPPPLAVPTHSCTCAREHARTHAFPCAYAFACARVSSLSCAPFPFPSPPSHPSGPCRWCVLTDHMLVSYASKVEALAENGEYDAAAGAVDIKQAVVVDAMDITTAVPLEVVREFGFQIKHAAKGFMCYAPVRRTGGGTRGGSFRCCETRRVSLEEAHMCVTLCVGGGMFV